MAPFDGRTMGTPIERVLRWVFGEEGEVLKETEMQIVMAATAIGVAGTFVVSPIISDLTGPLDATEAQVGQIITAFVAPSILLVPVMGMLADRVGRKPILTAGLAVFGLGGGTIGIVGEYTVVLGLRVLQGIGYAAIIPVGVTMIGDLYESSREATAQGGRIVSIQIVGLVSPPLAGLLVLGSWRYPFLLYFLAIGVAAWAWIALPTVQPSGGVPVRRYVADLASMLRDPMFASVMSTFAVRFVLTTSFITYISVLLVEAVGASAFAAGIVVSAYSFVSLVGSTQAGRVIDAWNSFLVLIAGFVVAGLGMVVIGIASSYVAVAVGMTLLGVGGGITAPVQKSLITQLVDPSLRGGAVSSASIFQSVGQTAAPLLMGLLLGYYSVGTTFAVFGVLGGLLGISFAVVAYVVDADAGALGDTVTTGG